MPMPVLARVLSFSSRRTSAPATQGRARHKGQKSFLAASLAAAFAFVGALPAVQAAGCKTNPEVHDAFDIAGLRSELMVTALSCKKQDNYNAFVSKFRPSLLKADKRLQTYFQATYGRQGQKKRDDYVTQLADVQSLGGLKSGTIFCMQRVPMFDEVNALDTDTDLAHYAEAKDILQPSSYESCEAPKASGAELTRKISHRRGRGHTVRRHRR
ncbi:hypothetical protein [Oecophyllibacter saccharovorans]|uniref:hypothetical protein n=1 Tax=Oecophyllibacter saccharovorans TaxID=2558360 RepID=UPI001E49280D|nr:hypothetical protein [Oecophyllibacter saccharovorans]